MSVFLKKAISWLKNYWYIPVVLVVAFVLFLSKKRGVVDWADIFDKARNSHRDEIDAIDAAHRQEIIERDKALKRMVQAEEKIRAEFEADSKELDVKTEKRVKKIISQLKGDPNALADELKKETGYDIIIVD